VARATQGDVGDRELPHGSARRPCRTLRESQCMARLHDEPGATVVIASIYAEQKHVAHVEFWACRSWNEIPPCGTLILSAHVKVRQFVGLSYRQFEKVRWLSEQRSYLKNRGPSEHASCLNSDRGRVGQESQSSYHGRNGSRHLASKTLGKGPLLCRFCAGFRTPA
jgi:hypothetical protein